VFSLFVSTVKPPSRGVPESTGDSRRSGAGRKAP
jgi:hypothetical protein